MVEPQTNPPFHRARSGQVREALDRLEGLVVDGLKHIRNMQSIGIDFLHSARGVLLR